jgi:hypothetical protein
MVLNEELAGMVRVSSGGLMLVYARHCPVAAGYLEHFYVRDSGVVEIEVDLPDSEENGVSFRSDTHASVREAGDGAEFSTDAFADLAEAIEALGEYLGCTDAWSIPARCATPKGPPASEALQAALRAGTYPLPTRGSFRYSGLPFWLEAPSR